MATASDKDPVSFKIDGRPFTIEDKHQTARALLVLAGLPADGYDLAEVKGPGEYKTYKDDQQVVVRHGDQFVSVRESAQVA